MPCCSTPSGSSSLELNVRTSLGLGGLSLGPAVGSPAGHVVVTWGSEQLLLEALGVHMPSSGLSPVQPSSVFTTCCGRQSSTISLARDRCCCRTCVAPIGVVQEQRRCKLLTFESLVATGCPSMFSIEPAFH